MVRYKLKTEGFGFNTEEAFHYFTIEIPRKKTDKVYIYEYFSHENKEDRELKVVISKEIWSLIAPFIEKELNSSLTKSNLKTSKFKVGQNYIERLLGKEACLLLYAIENLDIQDADKICNAVANWLGIDREFRWFLFTMINAAVGTYSEENLYKGWRQAIKIALIDNPVSMKQLSRVEGLNDEVFYRGSVPNIEAV